MAVSKIVFIKINIWNLREGVNTSICVMDFFPFSLMQLTELSEADREALSYILKASMVMDEIFHAQVAYTENCFFVNTFVELLSTLI